MRISVLLPVAALAAAGVSAQRPLNLLFYGNSYSLDNGTVPAMVRAIAAEAGPLTPRVVPRLFGGTNLAYHRTDPAQVAAISNSLPAGETWDYVVIQGLSVEPTVNQGDPAAFRANAVGIVANVRAHSPAARAVLYQTWARAPGHPLYPAAFPNAWAMHTEVRDNYALAARDIDQAFGPGTARVARAGDAVARIAFNPAYYNPDLSHPGLEMTILAGMTVYSAIWQTPIYTLTTNFAGNGPLATHFRTYNFTAVQWTLMRGYADMVADRPLRRFPGSSEDLLVRCTVTGADAAAVIHVNAGNRLTFEMLSPNARYSAVPAAIFIDNLPRQANPTWPEFWLQPSAVLLAAGPLGTGLSVSITVPPVATPLFFQGVALGTSTVMGGRPFTCPDGQELHVH